MSPTPVRRNNNTPIYWEIIRIAQNVLTLTNYYVSKWKQKTSIHCKNI